MGSAHASAIFLFAFIAAHSGAVAFDFVPDSRRDPFTFSNLRDAPDDPTPRPPLIDVSESRRMLSKACAMAEEHLLNGNIPTSISACDRALDTLNALPSAEAEMLSAERERALRLRRAATRLLQREEAERAFHALGLRASGAVAGSRQPRCIINGQVLGSGELLSASSSDEPVLIESVQPEQVIVIFRGYRMRLDVGQGMP